MYTQIPTHEEFLNANEAFGQVNTRETAQVLKRTITTYDPMRIFFSMIAATVNTANAQDHLESVFTHGYGIGYEVAKARFQHSHDEGNYAQNQAAIEGVGTVA